MIHPTAIIYPGVIIGENVSIGAYSVIGSPPEHREYYDGSKETKGVRIDRDVRIFDLVTVHAGTESATSIGRGASIQNHSHVGHDCRIEWEAMIGGSVTLAGHVWVMNNAVVAGHSAVHQWAVIGPYAILSAASYLKAHIPPGEKWIGSPARPAGANQIALERAGLQFQALQEHLGAFFSGVIKERENHGL